MKEFGRLPRIILASTVLVVACDKADRNVVSSSQLPDAAQTNPTAPLPRTTQTITPEIIRVSDCTKETSIEPKSYSKAPRIVFDGVTEFSPVASEVNFTTTVVLISQQQVKPLENVLTESMQASGFRKFFGSDGFLYQESLDLPESVQGMVWDQVNLINGIMRADYQIVEIDLFDIRGESSIDLDGGTSLTTSGEHRIRLEAKTGKEILIRDLEISAFHEAMHIFYDQVEIGQKYGWVGTTAEIYNGIYARRRNLTSQLIGSVNPDSSADLIVSILDGKIKLSDDLFNRVTESCYMHAGGHPWDNPDEMITSTATVMHFFPDSFIGAIGRLNNEDRQIMVSLSRHVIDTMVDISGQREKVMALFDQKLLRFLGY